MEKATWQDGSILIFRGHRVSFEPSMRVPRVLDTAAGRRADERGSQPVSGGRGQ